MTYIVFVFIYLKFLLVNASVDVATSDVDQLPPDPRQQQRGLERYNVTQLLVMGHGHLEEDGGGGQQEGELVRGGEAVQHRQPRPVRRPVHPGQPGQDAAV